VLPGKLQETIKYWGKIASNADKQKITRSSIIVLFYHQYSYVGHCWRGRVVIISMAGDRPDVTKEPYLNLDVAGLVRDAAENLTPAAADALMG
jgi:hypothetical protein